MAGGADHRLAGLGTGLGFHQPGRHADSGGVGRRLGRHLLSAQHRRGRRALSRRAGPARSPIGPGRSVAQRRAELESDQGEIEHQIAADYQAQSYLGRFGKAIEPAVRPLGWDWRIGCAVIASFPAREVVMGALGVIYHLGSDLDVGESGDQNRLIERLQAARHDGTDEPVFTVAVALSLMVFFALCAQCASTLAVIRRETQSWLWPLFTFGYMTTLAYLAALATYQIGRLLGA